MKKENKIFIIYCAIFLIAIGIIVFSAISESNKENTLYEKIFNLDWSDHMSDNYTSFEHWPYMKGEVFEEREGWRYIKAEMKHNLHPWEDMTVALRYNVNTGEQIITYWLSNIEVDFR